jgi:CubicO group peptidase (beta-lactamase class C family)
VWAQGFGYADVARQIPATPQTIYRIASITKLFTATAVLQLRDAGKLQLDDPIHKHLPWFTIQNEYEDAPTITIRHLLTHTAGLPREAKFPYWTDNTFPTLAQIQETIGQQATAVPSETRWKYSNLGLALAGEIVAVVSGRPYEAYIHEHILQPLGMNSTFVETLDPNHERLAVGYGRRLPGTLERQIMPFSDCKGITAAGNIATTVEDLAKFAMFHLGEGTVGGQRILRQSTLQEMQRIHWLEPGWQAGWGLGFRIQRQGNKTTIGHGGALLGYRTLLTLWPADKVGVIVLTNSDDGDPLGFTDKLFQWVVTAVAHASQAKPTPKQPNPTWEKYVGKYRDLWGDVQILNQNGELIAIDPSLPDPMLAFTRLVPIGEHTFRMESDNGFMAPGEVAIFHLDEGGTAVRLQTGENFRDRIERW